MKATMYRPLPSQLAQPPKRVWPNVGTQKQRGFTLIEILVAMLVAAFGILGVVGMNATSIKLQADSANRSQAALYAQDIFDRMRANRVNAVAGRYNRTLKAAVPADNSTMANQDLRTWMTNLQRGLPLGDAAINVNAIGDATVTIQWFERQNRGSAANNVSFVFTSSL